MPAISNLLSIGQCVRYGLGNGMRNPLLKLALNSSGRPSLAVPGSRILLVSGPSWAITGVFPVRSRTSIAIAIRGSSSGCSSAESAQ